MNKKKESEYLTVKQVAEIFGVSIPTLRNMRQTTPLGKLERLIGKRIKFSREEVMKYVKGGNDESMPWSIPTGQLSIVSLQDRINLEVKEDLFDLRGLDVVFK